MKATTSKPKAGDVLTYFGEPGRFYQRHKLKLIEPTKSNHYPENKYWKCYEIDKEGNHNQPVTYSEDFILARYKQ